VKLKEQSIIAFFSKTILIKGLKPPPSPGRNEIESKSLGNAEKRQKRSHKP
jgi:hypothetical protein